MPTEEQPTGDLERLAHDLDQLRRRLDAIDERLARLESMSAPHERAAESRPTKPETSPEVYIGEDDVEIVDAAFAEEPAAAPPPAISQPAAVAASSRQEWSQLEPVPSPSGMHKQLSRAQSVVHQQWEDIVGGRWMTWAGALTLIVAVAFFVPWAWTQWHLPDWFKVLVLHAAGAGVCVAAFVLHRREMKVFAQGLAGLGIFTLYASAWAAQHHYGIWGDAGEAITFVECAAITALAIAAAVAARSAAIVLLGALGGYLTPILASGPAGEHVARFTFLAFLNVALVGAAVLRNWSFLKPIALLATIAMFVMWLGGGAYSPEEHTWSTQWLLSLHWLIFLVGATLPPVVWRRRSDAADLGSLAANSLWFVGVTWMLFHERPGQQLALVCWGMTALHLGLFGLTYNRVTNVDRMPRMHLALAAIFFILAMPLQLEDSLSYLGLAWAAQGVVLTAVGIYFRDRQMCISSLIVFALAALRLMAFDYLAEPEPLGAVDRRFVMFTASALLMILAGALYPLAGRLLRKGQENALFWEPAGGALMAAGNLLLMMGLTCQWHTRLVLLLWTLDAAAIWAAGFILPRFQLRGAEVRGYGLLLGVLLVGGRAIYHGDAIDGTYALLLNDRFGTLALVAAVYFAAAWAYRKFLPAGAPRAGPTAIDFTMDSSIKSSGERILDPIVGVLANIVLVVAFSLEVRSWYDAAADAGLQPFGNMQMAEQASYSILWAVYAAAAVVAGLILRWPVLRYVGLAGLALTLAKVFLVDLASLRLLARVLALAVLGVMLLAVSFIYQRFAAKLRTSADG